MKKANSFTETTDIRELLLQKESENYLETDEIYKLIKADYQKKLTTNALKFLPLDQKYKKSSVIDYPHPPKAPNPKQKQSTKPLIPHHRNNSQKANKISTSLSLPKMTCNNTFSIDESLLNTKSVYSLLDKKISFKSLLNLRARFFSNQRLTRGELTEMMFGKKIPMINIKSFSGDYQKKIKKVLSNCPQLIIYLIEYGTVSEKEVIDYFNLDSLSLSWNEELEKIYREIVYNKNKTNSNMLKTTFFLVNIGFHKILKQKFDEKHYITTKTYNQKEIDEFAMIYEKMKKYDLQTILRGYSKLEMIFQIRDEIIHNKITSIRNKFFTDKVEKFRKIRNKNEKCLTNANEEIKQECQKTKVLIHNLRENLFKRIPSNGRINTFVFRHPITKLNRSLHNSIDIKNIIHIKKIKQSKMYIKTLITTYQKDGLLPDKETKGFNWQRFIKKGDNPKKLLNYFTTVIQANIRGYMIRKWLKKMQKCALKIQIKVLKYINYKKMVMHLFKTSVDEIQFIEKCNPELYRAPARRIRQIIHAILRNYPCCSFYIFNKDIEDINLLYDKGFVSKPINVGQIVKSHKLLIFLDNCLFKLYHHE